MAVVHSNLQTQVLPVAEFFLAQMGHTRPDLDAESFIGAMSELMWTPEYFCAQTIKVCPQIYKPIDIETDISNILSGMPAESNGFIDRLY